MGTGWVGGGGACVLVGVGRKWWVEAVSGNVKKIEVMDCRVGGWVREGEGGKQASMQAAPAPYMQAGRHASSQPARQPVVGTLQTTPQWTPTRQAQAGWRSRFDSQ